MASVKTAISIDEPLLRRIDQAAKALHMSRSRLLAVAAREFVEKHENRRLLQAVNEAYSEEDGVERKARRSLRRRHRDLAKGEW